MSLRFKTLFITVGVVAGSAIVMLAIAGAVLRSSYLGLEKRALSTQVARVTDALREDVDAMSSTSYDWANWDDTYEFASGVNPHYPTINLTDETLGNLGLDLVVIADRSGRVLFATTRGLEDSRTGTLPDSLRHRLEPGGTLLTAGQNPAGAHGFLPLAEHVMIVSSRPVMRSDLTGPPAGTLVFGRVLDESQEARLGEITRSAVRFHVPSDPEVTGIVTNGEPADEELPAVRVAVREGSVAGYTTLEAVDRGPGLVLAVEIPRDIVRGGLVSYAILGSTLLGTAVAATLVFSNVLNRMVVSRVEQLSAEVRHVTREADPSLRVFSDGDDEIAGLADGINTMLNSLEHSQAALERLNQELERRVEDRTRELVESESRYRALVENMSESVLATDDEGRVVYASSRAEQLFGRAHDAIVGWRLQTLVADRSVKTLRNLIATCLDGAHGYAEVEVQRPDGSTVPVELSGAPLPEETARVQIIARDITERKRSEAQVARVATYDHLTGLVNRRTLEEELDRAIARTRREGGSGALVWLDLDRFARINDTLGHRVGDELLVHVGHVLRQVSRKESTVARIGSDEFAVLLPSARRSEAEEAAARLIERLDRESHRIEGRHVRITASAGVAIFPEPGLSAADALRRAGSAMHIAKESGRDRYHVYAPDDEESQHARETLAWTSRIREALERDGFVLHAQPVLDLRTQHIARYELFVRMRTSSGESIPPGDFLPVALEAALAQRIDAWVVREAVRLIGRSATARAPLRLDVNVCGYSCRSPWFAEEIASAVLESGIEPSLLGFEVAESAAIEDIGATIDFGEALKEIGCRFALDDFGAGFSSFYYLKHLPIDSLKIDGSYIVDLARDRKDQHLVKAMVEIARGLDKQIVAECVEDAASMALLQDYGVDLAQGFYVRPAGPVDEVLLERRDSVTGRGT